MHGFAADGMYIGFPFEPVHGRFRVLRSCEGKTCISTFGGVTFHSPQQVVLHSIPSSNTPEPGNITLNGIIFRITVQVIRTHQGIFGLLAN